jgi:hypothetical protein
MEDRQFLTLRNELQKHFIPENKFVCLGHRKLTSCKKSFNFIPLKPRYARDVNYPVITKKFNLPIERLKCIDDVAALHDNHYGLSIVDDFPLVDAIIQPDTLIQYTISPDKHKGFVEKLPDIRAQLREKDQNKHMIIFVVPVESLGTFKYQDNLNNIKQYITTTEPIVVARKKNKKNKKTNWTSSNKKKAKKV